MGKDTSDFSCVLVCFERWQSFLSIQDFVEICHTFLYCFLHCAGNPLRIYTQVFNFLYEPGQNQKVHLTLFSLSLFF